MGREVLALIFATDKTQLNLFNGNATAYPLYMTLGNIDSDIRAAQSKHAWILVGYLPTVKLKGLGLTEAAERTARAQLFHYAMKLIVEPLEDLGHVGKELTCGDGLKRKCFPILACYVGDYPEQSLISCTRTGSTCPKCPATKDEFGDNICYEVREQSDTLETIHEACEEHTLSARERELKDAGLNAVIEPFWKDLPHCNIHDAITPDILHQLYQGVVMHVVSWAQSIVGERELDARYSRLPPVHSVTLFKDGISSLTHVSGTQHKNIVRQLLGCMVGKADVRAVRATQAMLDFLYMAQYHSHSSETLEYLQEALDEFHEHKDVFLELKARDGTCVQWLILRLFSCDYQGITSSFQSFTHSNTTSTLSAASEQPMATTQRRQSNFTSTTSRRPTGDRTSSRRWSK